MSEDKAATRITAAIADAIKAGELGDTTVGMPGAWALVGVYHDQEGDARSLFLTRDGQLLHETLGLLDMGQTVWRNAAVAWARGDEAD